MPITEIQAQILRRIAANRSPDSYVAGATVIHRTPDSPRYSQDLDFFHDLEDSIAQSAETDAATLRESGYEVAWLLRTPAFHRAVVTASGGESVKMEWAQDSAFRFFPVQEDERFGYRLHDADAAINKVLALAGRDEVRDFLDVLHLHATYLSLGSMVWAACGKDPGFTPDFLLGHIGRHSAYTQADVDRLQLREPWDVRRMKQDWLSALAEGKKLAAALPPGEVGCLYLESNHRAVTPDPAADSFGSLIRHRGSVRGAWPRLTL